MQKKKEYIIIQNIASRKSNKNIAKITFYEDEDQEDSIELQIFLKHFKNHLKQEQRHLSKKKV
jgi:hypothetical protein